MKIRYIICLLLGLLHSSCGFKVSSSSTGKDLGNEISGIISPLIGLISENRSSSFLISSVSAAPCADPVYAKLFKLQSDGTIDHNDPLATQLVGADARYSFNRGSLGITTLGPNVQYIVQAQGCNSDNYKRPITNFDTKQDIDSKTTVIAEVINTDGLVLKKMNEVLRTDVELLMYGIDGNSNAQALHSLTTQAEPSRKFTEIFGSSPTIIQSAKPEVRLELPGSALNELSVNNFMATAFHVDPSYSFSYVWKLDGVVKSTQASWNYIPGAGDAGSHTIDFYAGKNDGNGAIDLTKPYYVKSMRVEVNNNIFPSAPNIALNSANLTPVNSNTVLVDIATGISMANCASFSHMAITDTANVPGAMQFNIDCHTAGTQTETVTFSSGDGNKTLYLWAIDNEGVVSSAKLASLVLDTQPPVGMLSFSFSAVRGGSTQAITLSATDLGAGLSTLDLFFSFDGGTTYSLLSHLSTTTTSYSWAIPVIDTSNAKLKLVATDFTNLTTNVYSPAFAIDSTVPTAPGVVRTSAATANSRTVVMSASCSADYDKILYSQSSTTPLATDASWEMCAATKNFTVTAGDGPKTIYAFTKDVTGNISASSNVSMSLDTTPPSAPVANLASANISSLATVSFTIPDCADRPFVLVSESMIAPTANDVDWQTCSTGAGAISYTMIGPVLEQTHVLYVYAKDAVGNISSSNSASVIYDITNPALNLSSSLWALYKGGDTIALSFSTSDANGISALKLEYTLDGTTYLTAATLATSATTYNWTVPVSNTTTAKIRLIAVDNAITPNSMAVYSNAFTVDSTSPAAPTLTRTTAAISNSSMVSMTVGSCADTASILVSETNTQPAINDPNWQACSTTVSNYNLTVSGDGVHTIYAWAKDLAGNRAASANSITMTYDATTPIIAVTTPATMRGNVNTGTVSWTLTETNVAASTNFIVEVFNGSNWSAIGTKAANVGVNTNQSYTLSNFSVPNINTATAAVRVTLVDEAGNSGSGQSGIFTIDSSAPVLSSFSINDGATYAGTSLVGLKVNVADNYSSANQISVRFGIANASTGDCQTEYADNNWIAWTSATTNIGFSITPLDGVKKICAWAKDSLGNISIFSPTSGTVGVDSNSIEYSTGNIPQIASFSVVRTSDGGVVAASGDPLTISWSATDVEGLDNNPISFSYTTDNTNWFDITSNLNISTSSHITWGGTLSGNPTATTGTVAMFNAPTSSYFKLKVQAKDMAGNTSAVVTSQAFNTGRWSVYAGNTERGDGGTGRSAVLYNMGYLSLFAINPINGDMYASDLSFGIRKLDAKTGIVSTFIKNGTLNLPSNGSLPANPMMPIDSYNNPIFDSKGRLYLGVPQSGAYGGAVIYQIDLNTSTVRQYAGGGLADDGGASSTSLYTATGGYSFDEQNSLYVWTYCGGVLHNYLTAMSTGKRIVKISQNSDGTPGTTTRVIGNCSLADPTNGSSATSSPAGNNPHPGLSTIAAWDSGNRIVVGSYGNAVYKINNGTVYTSNIASAANPRFLYNPGDGLVYRATSSSVEKISFNMSGASGDTITNVFNFTSTSAGCSADWTSSSNYCGVIGTMLQIRAGVLYFADGAMINSPTNFAIRYFDANSQLHTSFGGQPFSGDGQNKSLMRGIFSGIYYKKSTEPNQAAFPEGLYFMEKAGQVFGRIIPGTDTVTQLWGNQARLANTVTTGTTISKDLSMGSAYGGGNGFPLTFDSSGLPWLRVGMDVVSLDANNKTVRRTSGISNNASFAPNNANPASYSLYPYTGTQNFALKNSGLFIMPNYVTLPSNDPIISIRYMDFTNSIMPIIIGGTYLSTNNAAASSDVSTPGNVAAAPLWTNCRGIGNCFMQYQDSSDRLYFSENNAIRYITTPDNTATSTLNTLFTASSHLIYNFSFTPDGSQLWYLKSDNSLRCHDISSGKTWCNDTTDHFTIRSAAGFILSSGSNQMTWKDNQTMFLSTYNGQILQFNLPTGP